MDLDAAFLLTAGSFLLTVELFYLQLTIFAFLLTVGALLLTVVFLLTVGDTSLRLSLVLRKPPQATELSGPEIPNMSDMSLPWAGAPRHPERVNRDRQCVN